MRVVLGGTFSPLHKGHKALFKRAFELAEGDELVIGLTSDEMAGAERSRMVKPFTQRKTELESYIEPMLQRYSGTKVEIVQINEVFNKAITKEREAGVLVVSEGKISVAEKTNELRVKIGKSPLEIVAVPYVLAQDGLPIKATRITNGEIDDNGKLLGTVRVAVGTKNDVKFRAVQTIFGKLFSNLETVKVEVDSGVRPQPWGDETITGAKNRAALALEQTDDAHFGVGIEAGLIKNDNIGKHLDVQYCAIHDRGGRVTIGHGSGFYYPDRVFEGVEAGRTVGEVMSEVTGVDEIGKKQGAIGYLSKGILSREELTTQAVIMALVPRITELYKSFEVNKV
jgi:inosine/xanthosine triphosphatase